MTENWGPQDWIEEEHEATPLCQECGEPATVFVDTGEQFCHECADEDWLAVCGAAWYEEHEP